MEINQTKNRSFESLTISGLLDCFKILDQENGGYEWCYMLRKISGKTREILGINVFELDLQILTDDVEIFTNLYTLLNKPSEPTSMDMEITISNIKNRSKTLMGRMRIYNIEERDINTNSLGSENVYFNFEITILPSESTKLKESIATMGTIKTISSHKLQRVLSTDNIEEKMNHDLLSLTQSSINLVNEVRNNDSKEISTENSHSLDLVELSLKSCLDLIDRNNHRRVNSNLNTSSNVVKIYVNLIRYVKLLKSKYPVNIELNINSNCSCSCSDYINIKKKLLEVVKISENSTVKVNLYEVSNVLKCQIFTTFNTSYDFSSNSFDFSSFPIPSTTSSLSIPSTLSFPSDSRSQDNSLFGNSENDSFNYNVKSDKNLDYGCEIDLTNYYMSDEILTVNDINFLYRNRKPVILFVDDSLISLKIISKSVSKILNNNNYLPQFPSKLCDGYVIDDVGEYVFVFAQNGIYAKDIAIMTNPKIIITDIQMPKMNGIQLIKELLINKVKSQIFINSSVSYESICELDEIPDFNPKFIQKGASLAVIRSTLISIQ